MSFVAEPDKRSVGPRPVRLRLLAAGRLRWPLQLAAAGALYIAAALATLPPLPGDQFHLGHKDNVLFLYSMEWARVSLLSEPQRFFEGLMYYGMGDSVFYTHLLLGGLPVYVPVATLFGPGAGINVLTIASPVLNAAAAAAAAWFLLGRWAPAVVAGFVFGFAPVSQEFFQYHHLLMAWWTPLALACWFWFLRRPTWWKFSGAWLCVLIQFATGIYLGFIALVTLLVLIGAAVVSRRLPRVDRRLAVHAVLGTAVAALPFVPLLTGYLAFWLDNQEVRTIDETRQLSARLPDYLPVATRSHYWFRAAVDRIEGFGVSFPALVPAALACVGLAAGVAAPRLRAVAIGLGFCGLFMFGLTLGPELWWNGELTGVRLPFAALREVVPGFTALRNPEFLAVGMVLATALLAAVAVDQLMRWRRLARWPAYVVAAGLFGLLIVEAARVPTAGVPIPYNRGLQAALAEGPDGPVAFIPMAGERLGLDVRGIHELQVRNVQRALWTLNGGRQPIVDGYSGYEPRGTSQLARMTFWADDEDRRDVLEALLALGVRTVVLDRDFLPPDQAEGWLAVIRAMQPSAATHEIERFVVTYMGPPSTPPINSLSNLEIGLALASAVAADALIDVSVTVSNPAERAWVPPAGQRIASGTLTWEPLGGGEALRQDVRLRLTPVIAARSVAPALDLVRSRAPATAGRYRVRLAIDDAPEVVAEVEVRAAQAEALAPLAADLRILKLPSCLRAGETTLAQVQALNSGAQPWGQDHHVGYRWSTPDDRFTLQRLEDLEGRLLQVQTYRGPGIGTGSGMAFEGGVQAPSAPGPYTLTLGVVKESWFGEIDLPIDVRADCG
ncbi:MAG: hypothetical protein OXP73_10740 [Chloroflexota bacterium]|nr:hypothetical protein [Chloroflexota bacterium]